MYNKNRVKRESAAKNIRLKKHNRLSQVQSGHNVHCGSAEQDTKNEL